MRTERETEDERGERGRSGGWRAPRRSGGRGGDGGRSGARLTGDERLGGAEANLPGGETGGAEEDPPSGWLGTTRRRRRGGCGGCGIPRARAQHARAKGGGGGIRARAQIRRAQGAATAAGSAARPEEEGGGEGRRDGGLRVEAPRRSYCWTLMAADRLDLPRDLGEGDAGDSERRSEGAAPGGDRSPRGQCGGSGSGGAREERREPNLV